MRIRYRVNGVLICPTSDFESKTGNFGGAKNFASVWCDNLLFDYAPANELPQVGRGGGYQAYPQDSNPHPLGKIFFIFPNVAVKSHGFPLPLVHNFRYIY